MAGENIKGMEARDRFSGEENNLESGSIHQAVLDGLSLFIFAADPGDGFKIVYANAALREILEEIMDPAGESIRLEEVVGEDLVRLWREKLGKQEEPNRVWRGEIELFPGSSRALSLVGEARSVDGEAGGTWTIWCREAGDEKAALPPGAEEEGHEELFRAGRFAGALAHEIRDPMGVIETSLYLLERYIEGPSDKVAKHFGRIRSQLLKINNVLDSMLKLNRPRSSLARSAPVDLLSSLRRASEECGASGLLDISDSSGGGLVLGSAEQLTILFRNLLTNAMEATKSASEPLIRASVAKADKDGRAGFLARLENNGDMIPASKVADLFKPFYSTKEHGMGLGLSISWAIASRHGGVLTASLLPEEEMVRFELWLPAAG